jgi:hypothetical protein
MELSEIKTEEDCINYLSEVSGIDKLQINNKFNVSEIFFDITTNNGDYSFELALSLTDSYDQMETDTETNFNYMFMDAVKHVSCYPSMVASRQNVNTISYNNIECEIIYSGSEIFALYNNTIVAVEDKHITKINKSDIAPIYFIIKKELDVTNTNLIEYFVLFSEFFNIDMKILMENIGIKEQDIIYQQVDSRTGFFSKKDRQKC